MPETYRDWTWEQNNGSGDGIYNVSKSCFTVPTDDYRVQTVVLLPKELISLDENVNKNITACCSGAASMQESCGYSCTYQSTAGTPWETMQNWTNCVDDALDHNLRFNSVVRYGLYVPEDPVSVGSLISPGVYMAGLMMLVPTLMAMPWLQIGI